MLSCAIFPVSGSPCVLEMQWSFRLVWDLYQEFLGFLDAGWDPDVLCKSFSMCRCHGLLWAWNICFISRGAKEVIESLSINTCGFMAVWHCPFDVAFDLGLQGHFVMTWKSNQGSCSTEPQAHCWTEYMHVPSICVFSLWHDCFDAWHFHYILWKLPERLV